MSLPPAPSTGSTESRMSVRQHAGLLSSAKTFFLPVGSAIDPEGVRGYPIDMRVKARSVEPASWMVSRPQLWVGPVQYALGAYERWLAGDGDQWLEAARRVADMLLAHQEPDGSWLHLEPFRHTFPLQPPWRSGLPQGEAASLLVRLHLTSGEARYADAARRALAPLRRPRAQDGVQAELDGRAWPEEYPTARPSFVLNGAIFAWWGFRDVGLGLGDADAHAAFERGMDTLAASLPRYDTGWWSRYSLYPHPIGGVASSFYHDLHIRQLTALELLAPRPVFSETRARWAAYAASAACRRRAFVAKVAFRVVVPRNRLLAWRMPWMSTEG